MNNPINFKTKQKLRTMIEMKIEAQIHEQQVFES
jgi:hypothetical protein